MGVKLVTEQLAASREELTSLAKGKPQPSGIEGKLRMSLKRVCSAYRQNVASTVSYLNAR
jgi:hypothetical protein